MIWFRFVDRFPERALNLRVGKTVKLKYDRVNQHLKQTEMK